MQNKRPETVRDKKVVFSCPAPFSELLGDGILETLEVNIRSKRECWRHVRVCTGMYGSGAGFVRERVAILD